jgi:hypothetical protein
VSGNVLVGDIVLRVETIFRVKTSDIWSGDDGAVALFLSWRHRFWRVCTSGVITVVVVLVLLGLEG